MKTIKQAAQEIIALANKGNGPHLREARQILAEIGLSHMEMCNTKMGPSDRQENFIKVDEISIGQFSNPSQMETMFALLGEIAKTHNVAISAWFKRT